MGTAVKYTQIKVSVDPRVATAFKNACRVSNISMAASLTGFMEDFAACRVKQNLVPDYSTRRQRRAALITIIDQLKQIKANEERVRDNMPENLQGSCVYDTAEEAVSSLEEAINTLSEFWVVP